MWGAWAAAAEEAAKKAGGSSRFCVRCQAGSVEKRCWVCGRFQKPGIVPGWTHPHHHSMARREVVVEGGAIPIRPSLTRLLD